MELLQNGVDRTVIALWLVSGRPTGPETRLFDLLGGYVRPIVLQFSK